MFLFRCCMRVNRSSHSELETEVTRTPLSSCDYVPSRHESQLQCRLLPTRHDTVHTKQLTGYSGCAATTGSCSLVVCSEQNVGCEEVLLVSVPSGKDCVSYTNESGDIICEPPCSIGIVNNNFSPDLPYSKNDISELKSDDVLKMVEGDDSSCSGNDECSDSSTDSSNNAGNDNRSDEVKYIADIRQFRSLQTCSWPHGENCCCHTCRSNDGLHEADTDYVTDCDNNVTCTCKSCVDFHAKMNNSKNHTEAVSRDTNVSNEQYKLAVSDADDSKEVHTALSHSVYQPLTGFASQNVGSVNENVAQYGSYSDVACPVIADEERQCSLDDDALVYSTDDELHYVFHKFIDDGRSQETFADVLIDDRMWQSVAPGAVLQLESCTELDHTLTKSADDLEVAYFMDRQLADILDVSTQVVSSTDACITDANPALLACSTQQQTTVSYDVIASSPEYAFYPVLDLDHVNCNLTVVETGFQPYKDTQVDPFNNTTAATRTNVIGSNTGQSEMLFDGLKVETNGDNKLTCFISDSNLNISNDRSSHSSQSETDDLCCSVTVTEFSDNSSVLPASSKADYISSSDLNNCGDNVITKPDVNTKTVAEKLASVDDSELSSQHDSSAVTGDDESMAEAVEELVQQIIYNSLFISTNDDHTVAQPSVNNDALLSVNSDNSNEPDSLLASAADIQSASQGARDVYPTTSEISNIAADGSHSYRNEVIFVTEAESNDVDDLQVICHEEHTAVFTDAYQPQQNISDEISSNADDSVTNPYYHSEHTGTKQHGGQGEHTGGSVSVQCDHIQSDDGKELNLHSHSTNERGSTVSTQALSPTGLVDDFFKQYVVPVSTTTTDVPVVVDEQPETASVVNSIHHHSDESQSLQETAKSIVDTVVNDIISVSSKDSCDSSTANLATSSTHKSAASSMQLIPVPAMSSSLLRSQSELTHKKSVHFADMRGLQLASVHHYDQPKEPEEPPASLDDFLSKLSAAAAARRAKWTEHHPSLGGLWLCDSSIYLLACFELSGSQQELLERVERCSVALESCSFDDLSLAISGVICVANLAFHKMISVRYTVDHWLTETEVNGEYIPLSSDGSTDRFSFTIILPPRKLFAVGSEIEFAIRYLAGDSFNLEFWDNNLGHNYVVRCCSKAANMNTNSKCNDDDFSGT